MRIEDIKKSILKNGVWIEFQKYANKCVHNICAFSIVI